MAQFGYTLYCEGNNPRDLVRQSILAEKAGFDFLAISDHYHPWLTDQSHSGFAWSILGAIAQATNHIRLATMVTCPIMRYHPAIIAQSAATISILSNDRFVLGIGSEERLNEHVIGRSWPSVTIRHEMLEEAIDIIRLLWQGGYQSYDGTYFQLDDARIFDLPQKPIPFFIAAGGEYAAHIAADSGGGICVTEPETGIIHAFIGEGGAVEDTWGQAVLSWDSSTKKALRTAHNQFRFVAGGWKVQSELPNPINFDNATRYVRPEDLAEMISCGPSADEHMKLIQTYLDSGVHSLAVVYPGTNHEGFMDFWQNQLHPQLVAPKNTDPQEVLRGQKKKVIEPKERIIPED